MRLSHVCDPSGLTLQRDGEFHNLGFLCHRYESMMVFLEERRFAAPLRRNESVCAVLTTPELAETIPSHIALATAGNPRAAFAEIHNRLMQGGFYWEDFTTEIDPRAEVHSAAWVAKKNVRIGANSIIGPQAAILERCSIGEQATIGAGVVLGGVGFQTVRSSRPMIEMRHGGGLNIHDGVCILPGAVIATGLFRHNTAILAETRIGAQAFISHDVQVGARSFVGHGAVINGNVEIGGDAWIGPGAIVANNLSIGERAFVSLGAVVIRDVPADGKVSGNFAIPHRRRLRAMARGTV
jgi:UDP-3-O-[3-hydroxymyristoyl] glucosamine N-acyltransferase